MEKKIGVVLSSGGGRGIYGHTGFLLAIEKLNIPVQAMAGCSAGAVVGGIVASGTPVKQWAKAIINAQPGQFWQAGSIFKLLYQFFINKGRGLKGIAPTNRAIEFCDSQLSVKTFTACTYPFYAVAVNLGTGEKKLLAEGSLAPAMMASAAMPVLYEPVEVDGEFYTDGAIIDLAPIDAICCRHQLDLLIIHHLAQRNFTSQSLRNAMTKHWSIIEILYRLIYRQKPWYATGEASSTHKCPCGCGADILVIEPDLPDLEWPLTKDGQVIMERAQKHAEQQLKEYFK